MLPANIPCIIAWKRSGVLVCENAAGPSVTASEGTLSISISLPAAGETPTTSIVERVSWATATVAPSAEAAAIIAPRSALRLIPCRRFPFTAVDCAKPSDPLHHKWRSVGVADAFGPDPFRKRGIMWTIG
jgi:hypothetical protein